MEMLTPIMYTIAWMSRREIPILNLVCHVKPNNNNLLPGFRVVLGSFRNSLLSNRKGKIMDKKATEHTQTKESLDENLIQKSSDIFQTSNLIEH